MPRTDDHYAIKLHNDGTHSPLVASWIQSIYDERDQALARNRELEQANEAAETMVSALTSLARDYEAMLTQWDPITPDFKTTGHTYDNQRLALRERYDALTGESK